MKAIANTKVKFLLGAVLVLALVFAFMAQAAPAQADGVPVTVQVIGSDSVTGVSGVQVRYGSGSNYTSAWFGTTGGSGTITGNLAPGTYSFQALYNNGHAEQMNVDVSSPGPVTVTFNTYKLTLRLEECDTGNGIDGGNARFGAGSTYTTSWFPGGATGSSTTGETEAEFFPGTYTFQMQYGGTAEVKPLNMPASNHKLTWQASKVTLHYSGQISYGGSDGDSTWFSKPTMYLLPGTYKFHFRGGGRYDLTISGCSMEKTVAVLKLTDHNGNPLAGGTARGGYATPTVWHVSGSTDSNGLLFELRDGPPPSQLSYEMKVNNTAAWDGPQDPTVDSIFEFQTRLLTLRLEDCNGNPLDGGNPRYGHGSTYTTWWFPGGVTGSSAAGETSAEFFPGTYSFEMQYQGTADAKVSVVVPDADTTLTWQTTKVTLHYSGQISYGGGSGDSQWFTKPSMELLPGTYKFHFRGGGRYDLTISGCSMEKTVNVLKLKDHNGNPLAGGKARGGYGSHYAGWWVPGLTDADGVLFDLRDGQHTTMSYEMGYNNTTEHKTQDVSANSIFDFQTILLTLRLETGGGTPLDGGRARYGSGNTYTTWWFPGGNTGSSAAGETEAEVFPGTYSFEMQYQGTAEAKVGVTIPNANTKLTWQTILLTLRLETCGGTPLDGGKARYGHGNTYTTWWFPGGNTGSSAAGETEAEVFPGTYSFEMQYQGTAEAKVGVNIPNANTKLTWQTTNVTLQYSGQISYGGGSGDSRWFNKPSMELLPGTYKFHFRGGERRDLTWSGCTYTYDYDNP
jgi:hypothetical protein